MSLQKEIDKARGEIRTDGYSVSIGEWISIYEKHELDIHPEFQRFFRWSNKQKSRLIESILLGIPIPPIFVAQRADGIWDVVDGLQRLSTIFEFVGILRDEKEKKIAPLPLTTTKYLKSLGGMRWEDESHPDQSFTPAQRLLIKRAKIDVSIILRESDENTKFELFQRLNTGGSTLSYQETRNCLLVMINRDFFIWVRTLADNQNFKECIALSDRNKNEQYDMELVLRFLTLRIMQTNDLKNLGDIGEALTEKSQHLAQDKSFDKKGEEEAFRQTFEILARGPGDDSFRRFDKERNKFVGGFSIAAFEAIALGIGYNYKKVSDSSIIHERIKQIWSEPTFTNNSGAGINAPRRISNIIPFGRQYFAK